MRWARGAPRFTRAMSDPRRTPGRKQPESSTAPLRRPSPEQGPFRSSPVSVVELSPARRPRRRPRPHAAAGHRGRAVRARRHAAEQGRDRRRRRDPARARLLPPRPPDHLRRDPRPLRPRRAGRRHHRLRRAHPHRRARPRRRRALPAHARRLGAHRGQRRLLRAHRAGARRAAPPGRGRHAHRADGVRRRRRRRPVVDRAQAAVYDVTDRRTSEDYLAARRHHGGHARGDRRDRHARRRHGRACPPASPTSTRSPTACTPAR